MPGEHEIPKTAGPTDAGPTDANPTDTGPTGAGQIGADPAGADPTGADPTGAAQNNTGQTSADQTGAGQADGLARTPLHDLHLGLGAQMVPFAGYEMPVRYPAGILREHLHTRAAAGLFDVSHMGQFAIRPRAGGIEAAGRALESMVPADVLGLGEGRQRYGLFTNDAGGIEDDLMFANLGDHLFVVVNAACKAADAAAMEAALGGACEIEPLDRGLIALQGPLAAAVLSRLAPEAAAMRFMDVRALRLAGVEAIVSRSGYTGEDGFEISVPSEAAARVAEALLAAEEVLPVGLGARDSLRLEAGLCLYGHDIDQGTTPVEAALEWAIQKSRRRGGARAGGFPGDARILGELETGAARRRVGLRPEGRAPMREGTEITEGAAVVGAITSGGFGPSLNAPVAMGYAPTRLATPGTALSANLRGKSLPVTVHPLPFIAPGYKRA